MNFKSVCSYTRTLFFLILLTGSLGLRDVELTIPESAELGKAVVIKCLYDLENEDLYQVKWYRGLKEFWRYEPREVPSVQIFPIPGIEVDLKRSDTKQLSIIATTLAAQGRYTCEVSADSPSFVTAQLHGFMYVVVLPKTNPELIWRYQRNNKPGMEIRAECFSYDSIPAANLSFYINNVPACSERVWHGVSGGRNGSLFTAFSTLTFIIQKHHIRDSKIRIRCTASIYSIYMKSDKKSRPAEDTSTTIWTEKTKAYPKHRQSENSVPWNRQILWVVCSIALIVYGYGIN